MAPAHSSYCRLRELVAAAVCCPNEGPSAYTLTWSRKHPWQWRGCAVGSVEKQQPERCLHRQNRPVLGVDAFVINSLDRSLKIRARQAVGRACNEHRSTEGGRIIH